MKLINNTALIIAILLTPFWVAAQNYKIENLGDAINSEYEEINPILSGDGSKLFFTRVNHPDNRFGSKDSQDIWCSELDEKGNWKEAERLSDYINLSRYNAVVWSNNSGDELIIQGVFDKKGEEWKKRGLSTIKEYDGKWSIPEPIKISGFDNINDGALNSVAFGENGSIMILSFSSVLGSKNSNLYISIKIKNKYSRPIKINDLSSKFDDQAPYINPDHNKIYFSTNRPTGGYAYKIYTADKNHPNDWRSWTEPQEFDFGQPHGGYISYFKMAPDGKSALFASNQDSKGNSDIFKVTFEEEVPETLTLNGMIIDEETGKPIPSIDFNVMMDGTSLDVVLKDADSARFEFTLQKRDSIRLSGSATGFIIDPQTFSLANAGNNLYDITIIARKKEVFIPAPTLLSVSASGSLTDRDIGSPIPSTANPVFSINDKRVDSVSYNPLDGNYQLNFDTPDSTLVLSVQAEGYLPYTKIVNFSSPGYVFHNVALKKRMASILVKGKILNTKTKAPVETLDEISVLVNGKATNNITILPEEKIFQLFLNKDSLYTVSAQAKGFFGTTENIDLRSFTGTSLQRDLLLTPIEVGQTVQLNNIFFATGSAELLSESIPELNRVADFLRENPTVVVEIAGHTDNVGSDTYNLSLSEKRAKSVARYIILKGFTRERIEFKGYGETTPVASNDTPEGREQNRRVEFKVIGN